MAGCKKEESFVDTMAQGVNDFVDQAIVGEEGKVFTITESSLQEILDSNELSTIEYTYNSIVQVKDENDKLKYSAYYSGIITAGIDFNKIKITVDDDNQTVNIKVPDAKINSSIVDAGSLEFIFENNKYDEKMTHSEAYEKSKEDLEKKANNNEEILKLAKENSMLAVEALLKPLIEFAGYEYTIE